MLTKETRTIYTITAKDGTYVTISLEGDFYAIRHYWANDELINEVIFLATRGTAADLVAVFAELEAVVIGE